jgi:hypothetical protein
LLGFLAASELALRSGPAKTIAVKIVDDRGIESLKVLRVE